MTLYTQKSSNVRKTWLIFTLFLIVVIGVGWVFSQAYGNPSILYIAVFFSIFMNVLSYWFSDKIVLKMAGAIPATHDKYPELYHIVENLAITAGLPIPKIYIIPERQPNAFATGRDPKHAVVAVTEGLLERLDKNELEGVVAHELSHIGNRDMLLSTVVVVLVGFISIISDIFLRARFFGGSRDDKEGNAGAVIAVLGIVFAIIAPIALTLMQLAISRKREFLADASGALLTRYPEGLASALEKIASDPAPMKRANNTTAHLWLNNPFKGKKISTFFMTHPPIEERVKALRNLRI
jgi:heat shock protein HtpX